MGPASWRASVPPMPFPLASFSNGPCFLDKDQGVSSSVASVVISSVPSSSLPPSPSHQLWTEYYWSFSPHPSPFSLREEKNVSKLRAFFDFLQRYDTQFQIFIKLLRFTFHLFSSKYNFHVLRKSIHAQLMIRQILVFAKGF